MENENIDQEINKDNQAVEELKQINPATDKGIYLVQIIDNNQVIKEIIAVNSTVRIIDIGKQGVAAILK